MYYILKIIAELLYFNCRYMGRGLYYLQ